MIFSKIQKNVYDFIGDTIWERDSYDRLLIFDEINIWFNTVKYQLWDEIENEQ